ncbi:MAG: hypothetical protein FRX48_05860 [Lasallia pustulata]|uniref:Integral membrane n=1 Tax=Lasallia pustulata TaxID=136370 RepID=A0A5M8PLZ3_9LECA|nr:MAG: hypothetical protein FRX48_05860 [Lasallia pustulata]
MAAGHLNFAPCSASTYSFFLFNPRTPLPLQSCPQPQSSHIYPPPALLVPNHTTISRARPTASHISNPPPSLTHFITRDQPPTSAFSPSHPSLNPSKACPTSPAQPAPSPLLLTLATLISLLLAALPGTPSPTPPALYFLRLNTSDIHLNATQISRLPLPAAVAVALSTALGETPTATQALNLSDWYTIHLWNYCSGPANTTTPTACSPPQAFFWFDPLTAWNLDSTAGVNASAIFPTLALDSYRVAARWMVVAYGVGFVGTALELLVGVAAVWSRVGALAAAVVGGWRRWGWWGLR